MRVKWVYVIGGAVAVIVLALVVVGVRGGGGSEPVAGPRNVDVRPSTPQAPETHPTQGEYVPPRPVPKTRAPERVVPTKSRPKPRPERRYRGDCPRKWAGIPFLRKWCERNGYRTR
ncbi:hypothetical protein [Actinomadura sp. 9N407]|uniref:hypothetical protein n=1 Tax=Actinomadura sp. 9N407 TaxID=3375154 RepID=UPI0037A548A1